METNEREEVSRTNKEEGAVGEWITLKEMQRLLNNGSTKAYELVASGEIPGAIKIGRVIRIQRSQLDAWLQEQAISKGKP
jgi:excisionase family DNA binding protein